jgi:nucleoside-diphosphate-sugar epimerase
MAVTLTGGPVAPGCLESVGLLLPRARGAKVRRFVFAANSSAYGDEPSNGTKREGEPPAAAQSLRRQQAPRGILHVAFSPCATV